jgi:hypothetical protein
MLFVGFIVVILSFLGGQWLSERTGVDPYWPMAAAWGIWAAADARRHDLKRYERVFPLEPFALLAAVTIMWPVALPWYLRLRHRIRTGRVPLPTRPSRARYALIALAFLLPVAAMGVPKLLERLTGSDELRALERAAVAVAGEPVHLSLDSRGTLTVTVFHRPLPGELVEERRDVAHRIAEAVVQASEEPEALEVVAVAFASAEGLPGMRAPRVGDVFQWRASELRRRTGVTT